MDLLTVRTPGDPGSLLYPEPGEVRDSILLAHADGLPAVHVVSRARVCRAGLARRGGQRVAAVHSSLIVTDCRTALASSEYEPGDHAMLVGHVRHGWLVEVAVAQRALRLQFDHPADGRMTMFIWLADPGHTEAVGRDIAARALTHSPGRFVVGSTVHRWRVLLVLRGSR